MRFIYKFVMYLYVELKHEEGFWFSYDGKYNFWFMNMFFALLEFTTRTSALSQVCDNVL